MLASDRSTPPDPNKPEAKAPVTKAAGAKKPVSGFERFCETERPKVVSDLKWARSRSGRGRGAEVGEELVKRWKALPDSEKAKWTWTQRLFAAQVDHLYNHSMDSDSTQSDEEVGWWEETTSTNLWLCNLREGDSVDVHEGAPVGPERGSSVGWSRASIATIENMRFAHFPERITVRHPRKHQVIDLRYANERGWLAPAFTHTERPVPSKAELGFIAALREGDAVDVEVLRRRAVVVCGGSVIRSRTISNN